MRDFNFFTQYLKQRKASKKRTTISIAIILVTVLLIGGSYTVTEMVALGIRMDTAVMKSYINSKEVSDKKKEIQEKKTKRDALNRYFTAVNTVKADIDKSNIIKSSLIEKINNTVPVGIVYNNITLASNVLTINGTASSRVSIAEFSHNLGSLDLFDSVHINSIAKKGEDIDEFSFDIRCLFKGGAAK